MVLPPSLESIKAAYENVEPTCIHVANGVARIRDRGSDGDESLIPPTYAKEVDHNTIDVLQEADVETVKHWLDKIGNYLIYEGDWHNLGATYTLLPDRNRIYTLKRFPFGYKLYTRQTGDRVNPRKDNYLYGSKTERCKEFRSPEEFALHAKWLAFERPRDARRRPLCGCCYCSKRPQGEISAMLRGKVSHLSPNRSSRGSTEGGGDHGRTQTDTSDVPVMAKDYTHLNEGEGVSIWVEGMGSTSREQ